MAFKMISVKTPIRLTQCNTHILELNNIKIGTHITVKHTHRLRIKNPTKRIRFHPNQEKKKYWTLAKNVFY